MDYTQYLSQMQNLIEQNNQWSAQQAERQMQFQENMSNTAHQREVADLVAAGLNPVLSARSSGASTPNGAMGDSSGSLSAMAQMLSTIIDTENANARAALAAAQKQTTSTSAYGNNNWLTDLLMATGLNKSQAQGISHTVDNLNNASGGLKELADKAIAFVNGLGQTKSNTDSSGITWQTSSTQKTDGSIKGSLKYFGESIAQTGYNILKSAAKGLYNSLMKK